MAGSPKYSKYETDEGNIVPISIQPETEDLNMGAANTPPAAAVEAGWPSADVSRSKRSLGIHARTVSVRFTATPPTGYAANVAYRVPVLKKAVWDAITKNTTGTYLGVACKFAGKSPEKIN